MAGAGGAVMGLAAYAVRNQNLEPLTAAAVLGAGGLLLGAAAAGWKPSVGAGIAGGGAALATGLLIAIYYTKDTQTSGLGAYHTAKRFAGAQAHYPAMGAVTAQVGPRRQLVMNGLGAVTAPVSNSLQLDLNGLS